MSTPFLATPEAVVEALSRAFSERRWREVARYLDKASVNEFHRWQVASLADRQTLPRRMTAEEFMRHDPAMPRDVADYSAEQHHRHQEDYFGHPEHEVAGVSSWAEIATLSPEDLVTRWLEAQDPVARFRRQRAQTRRPLPPDDYAFPVRRLVPLGHVREADLAHVVCREVYDAPVQAKAADAGASDEPPDESASQSVHGRPLQVLTVRHNPDGNWYALFDYVLATAGNRVMVYEEVRPDDTAPPDDADGAAARR